MATESKPIELGTKASNFSLLGTDEKRHSLNDYASSKVLVIAFTCNHCPYVQAYENRMIDLTRTFKHRGVSLVCINSNDDQTYPDDSFERMKERATKLKFNFDYLRDQDQSVARAYNAACTPEFYVYDELRILRYHGRLDDNQKDPAAVKHFYLRDVIEDLLSNQKPRYEQTSAIGCSIKWK